MPGGRHWLEPRLGVPKAQLCIGCTRWYPNQHRYEKLMVSLDVSSIVLSVRIYVSLQEGNAQSF